MSSSSKTQNFNPLGKDVEELLAHTEPAVTPHQLLEVVTEMLEKQLPGNLSGKARQNVILFLVENEYKHNSKSHISHAVQLRIAGRWSEEDPYDNSNRVDLLITEYNAISGTIDESEDSKQVNQSVGPGGLTKLHLAAMDGEYEEVVRLVEKEKASITVLDNLRKTPYDRARAFGHHRVAEYLLKRSKAAGA